MSVLWATGGAPDWTGRLTPGGISELLAYHGDISVAESHCLLSGDRLATKAANMRQAGRMAEAEAVQEHANQWHRLACLLAEIRRLQADGPRTPTTRSTT